MDAAMAIAATWTISTALSPTTWQPRIVALGRSTISLQKPSVHGHRDDVVELRNCVVDDA
jgi:hypothetical protein